jgi:hypothetical protein
MASIALTVIGCIDYLAYGTIFTCATFCQKRIVDVFFLPKKPKMSAGRWCGGQQRLGVWACCWCRTTGVRIRPLLLKWKGAQALETDPDAEIDNDI